MIKFRKPNKRPLIIAITMITLGIAGLGIGVYKSNSSQAEVVHNTPNFETLLPNGKTIEELGGWEKLTAPNGEDVFYVYVDNVGGVLVNVSQQNLPGKFKGDETNKMTELARAYNANTKLEVDEDTTVYIGTSAQGPQSVLFTKNDVLVLMKSWSTISDADWITYIKSLK